MPKGLVVFCWVWIGIWFVYKVFQISSGYILDALDFSNPSLAGIIAVVCIVLLIINSIKKKSEKMLPEEITCPNCEAVLELDQEERIEKKFNCPECKQSIDMRELEGSALDN